MKITKGRIDDIEALRAVAVLLVVLGHIRFLFKWDNTHLIALDTYVSLWSGVDLFFAISGFVIARDLLKRYESCATSTEFWRETLAFWVRRVYRIWPTAWLWAGLLLVFGLIFRGGAWPFPKVAMGDLAAVMLHVANVHHWMCANRMPDAVCGPTTVWWSLSLEEQFYLALPIIAMLTPRRFLPHVLGAIVAAQFFLDRPVWSLMWVLRTDALALGVLIAIFERSEMYQMLRPTFLRARSASIPLLLGLFFLLVEIPSNLAGKSTIVPFSAGLTALVAGAIVLIASYNQDIIVRDGILKPVWLWFGSRSYGIYIIHAFCLNLTVQIWRWIEPAGTTFGPNFTLRFLAVFLSCSLILAELNYRLIETPLRKRGRIVAEKVAKLRPARKAANEDSAREIKTVAH